MFETSTTFWLFVLFNVLILVSLIIDLGVFNRKSHEIGMREAIIRTIFWVAISLLFSIGILIFSGTEKWLKFLTGYVVELSLSADNVFVFVLIFSHFKVPSTYQHRVLFWGILGALVMRGFMILLGIQLITRFHWIIYVFGAFLIITGIKTILVSRKEPRIEDNVLFKFLLKHFSVTKDFVGDQFFVKKGNKIWVTPLFIVLILIELTDLIFAVDSIPAILAISHDPFIVYSSNVFAILGLRSLYFTLAGMVEKFHLLKVGLGIILTYIGIKMSIAEFLPIPVWLSLLITLTILGGSIGLSFVIPRPSSLNEDTTKRQ